MSILTRDPLLAFARGLLYFLLAVLGFAAAMLILGAIIVPFAGDRIVAEMAREGIANGRTLVPALSVLLLAIGGLLGLAMYFMRQLLAIVVSVSEGDPFIPANAERLSRMGWTALTGHLLALPVGALEWWFTHEVKDGANGNLVIEDHISISLSGIMLILTLFILARVFRQGAMMRAELEGTV